MKKKDDYFDDILKEFTTDFQNALLLEYDLGGQIILENAKQFSKKVKTKKTLNISKKQAKAMQSMLQDLIKDVTREISKKINNKIDENIATGRSTYDLVDEIKQIFDKDAPEHLNYKNRFKTIAITESNRVMSIAADNNARNIGATKKYLIGVNDNKQGDDSKAALAKYGSPEKAIPIDEPFKFTHKGKTYEYMLPPNRPNDREIPLYVFGEEA